MMQSVRSDKAWLRLWLPNATPAQIHDFTERVGLKVDDADPPADVLERARDEALKELRIVHD